MSRRGRTLLLLALIPALAFAACGGGDDEGPPVSPTGSSTAATTATGGARTTASATAGGPFSSVPADLADGFALGKKDAPLTLVLYEDFQCPFCLRFTQLYDRMLVEEYVQPGKLRLEFRNLPILGAESVAAARGATCAAAQNGFWAYHHRLFEEQLKAGQLTKEQVNVGRFSAGALRTFAGESGLDAAAWQACFEGEGSLQAVQDAAREASGLGLRSTPSLILNGKPLTIPPSAAAFRGALDDALKNR
jgi:protein-disulfide isomerase